MKIWQASLLILLLVTMPILSACDLLGIGSSRERQEQEYYRQQLETYKKIQEANRQQREEYNKRLQQGLEEYFKEYQKYQQQAQQQQLQQIPGTATDNQS